MSPPLPVNLLRVRGSPVRAMRVAVASVCGATAGAALALTAATFVTPVYRATADVEFVQAPGTLPLSDAARDARIDGFVEAARSLPVAAAALRGSALGSTAPPPADDAAALALIENVRAERIGATALLRLDARSDNPAGAARLAAALATALIERSLADRIAAIAPPDAALEADLALGRTSAEAADSALAMFRARVDLGSPAGSAPNEAELASLRASTTGARGEAAAAATRAAAAARHIIVPSSTVGQNGTASLAELRGQRATVDRRRAILADGFAVDYPPLVSARAELATLDRAIAAELGRLSGSAHADAAAANARAIALGQGLAGVEQRRARTLAADAELARLQRLSDAARETYRLLNQGVTQRTTERSLARPELRLAVPPSVPLRPVSPDRLLVALFGALALGLAAGVAAIWAERRRLEALRFEI